LNQAGIDIISAVRDSGVVGAGGAGFPTHVKLSNRVDTIIANGAECEPIIESDKYLMQTSAPDIVHGLELAMEQAGAEKGVVAVKEKNTDAITALKHAIAGNTRIELGTLGNYYPAGDEIVLIRQITGRVVPPGKLPFTAGVTVCNVATLKNISGSVDGKSVNSRIVTVGGAVANPVTVEVPVGTVIDDLINFAGGATSAEYEVVAGGPVMGPIVSADDSVTKTIGGVIVLPADHTLIKLKCEPVRVTKLRAKMCCTCQECTILCPRNALGHPISPAKMMTYSWHIDEIIRRIEHHELDSFTEQMIVEALLCCQCGLCEQYACIFGLAPNKVYALVRDAIGRSGLQIDFSEKPAHEGEMFNYRKLSTMALARKLDLERYIVHTEFKPSGSLMPKTVRIPLLQHIGVPAVPVVNAGDMVKTGDTIGEIPDGKLGARVHASIDGRVGNVTETYIEISAGNG
jgi:Na+-translocating ferredoxin:NAD+ oxidoreductase RnfC subunit